ncbi:MAG TPA: FtsX-like permease family protein [Gaiellaceae bacterium]|nr:FtsX-like permease family protein [Gaiellaceae bacterium]
MIGVALKGLVGRKLRSTLTAFAIVLGVAMISGSFVLTDTLGKSFDGIYSESYKATDAVISSEEATNTGDNTPDAPAFSAAVLGRVESLPGVRLAQGSIEDQARLVDESGKPIGTARDGIAIAVDPSADQSLNPLQLVTGQWPRGDGQIAVDKATAEQQHLAVGGTAGVFADGPLREYRISGIVRFGSVDSIGSSTITVFDLPTAQQLFDKEGKLDLIRVGAEDGVPDAELLSQIRPLLSETTQVKSAAAQASADSEDTQEGLSFMKYFLLGFGGIALFVGSFVIANTLAITVAQRMRELATLRTLGASRRQVLGSVVLESVAVGIVGSIVGLFLGLGIAVGLKQILAATGVELPDGGIVFSPRTIVVSLAVGTLIALLASLRPALRATRIEPIAAVREGAVMPPSRFARYALPTAAVVAVAAVALFSYGVFADGVEIKLRLLALVAGVLLLFVGVAMIASRVVRPLAFVLGAPGARFGGTAGALARQNAVRNPARTASTAAAVMIGLALITFVAVIGQGFRSSFTSAVEELFVADYAVTAGDNPLTNKAAEAAATAPGVEAVSEIRAAEAELAGSSIQVNGVDGNLTEVVAMEWSSGSDSVPAELGRDGAFIKQRYAEDHSLAVGSPLVVTTPTGTTLRLEVEGIFDEPKGGSPFGDVAISTATFDESFATHANQFTLLNVRGGPTAENTAQLEQAVAAFPDAEVETRDEFKDGQLAELTTSLKMLYALLGLSVIVSLFGVVNTLVLSVFERTREIGMLRAIGMNRRQIRRMVRHESIVTALIGATLGIAVGIFLAGLTTLALSDYGIVFAIPYGSLAAFVAVAILAGSLAAILPARRASRLNVLQALQYE